MRISGWEDLDNETTDSNNSNIGEVRDYLIGLILDKKEKVIQFTKNRISKDIIPENSKTIDN